MKSQIGRRTRGWVLCATGGLVIAGPSLLPADEPTDLRWPPTTPAFAPAAPSAGQAGFARIVPSVRRVPASPERVLREPGRLPSIEGGTPISALTRVRQTSAEDSEAARYMEALYAREVPEAAPPSPYAGPVVVQEKPGLLKRFFRIFRRRSAEQETLSSNQLLRVPPAPAPIPGPVQSTYFPAPVPHQASATAAATPPPAPPPAPAADLDVLPFNPFDELPQTAGPPPAPPVSDEIPVLGEADPVEEDLPMLGEEPVAQQPSAGGDSFDPFSELSEEEADRSGGPFTGLTLDDVSLEGPDLAASSTAEDAADAEKFEPPIEKPASLAERVKLAPPSASETNASPAAEDSEVATASSDSEHGDKLAKIKARQHRQGLKGFCPVVLRDERDLRDTRPEFSARYMGVTYNFSSAEAQQKFESDPEKYAPIQGGTDVVLLVSEQTHARGSIEHAVWYRDRLYLFSDGTSMQTFKEEPSRYVQER